MTKRFRIEIDAETPDTATEQTMRVWLQARIREPEWPDVVKATVVQTEPEVRT